MFKRFIGGDGATQAGAPEEVDVVAAYALQQGSHLIDIREPSEYRAGHAKGVRNIPLSQLSRRLGEMRTDTTVLLICCSGNRSRAAQGLLRRHDLTAARNVRGGMLAWHAARLPEQ